MNDSCEVEYCDLEVALDKTQMARLASWLSQGRFDVRHKEGKDRLTVSVSNGKETVKLRFKQRGPHARMTGVYFVKSLEMSGLMEQIIIFAKGSAVIKRFFAESILIESVLSGEIVKMVEIAGLQKKVLYEKKQIAGFAELERLYLSKEGEARAAANAKRIDAELDRLSRALKKSDEKGAERAKGRLEALRRETLALERF